MSEGSGKRTPRTIDGYTVVPNWVFEMDIGPEEKLILIYLWSKPNDWIIRKSDIRNRFYKGKGKGTVDLLFRRMVEKGLLTQVQGRNEETGLWSALEYKLNLERDNHRTQENRSPVIRSPVYRSPVPPLAVNLPLSNTNNIVSTEESSKKDLIVNTDCSKVQEILDPELDWLNEMNNQNGTEKS